MRRLPTLLLGASLLWLVACGSSPTRRPEDLIVSPTSGPPGAVLAITGLELSADEPFEVWLGDEQAPARLNEDGTLSAAVPLFLGPDNWPAPPAEPQTVEVRQNGVVLGRSSASVTVTDLPKAPGSTQAVQTALADITDAYETLFSLIPVADEAQTPIREGVIAMLRGAVSEGEDSLEAVLNGTSPLLEGAEPDTELVDALLASSGALDYFREYAAALDQAEAALETQASAFCNGDGPDFDLACQMQIYVVLNDYSKAFVKPTAETWANTVGLAAGLLAIGTVAVPPAAIVGAILSVADFVMEKIAPALFPSQLTQFELKLPKNTIEVGEMTDSKILVAAANNPPQITYLDIVEQVKTLAGLKNIEFSDKFYEILKATFDFTIDFYLKLVKTYEASHPGSYPWVTAGDIRMPKMSWGPVEVQSERLVALFSFDEGVAEPHEDVLEWQGLKLGETTVRVMPRGPGEKSKVLVDNALCWGCVYSGGAFGNEMPDSKADLVVGDVQLTASPSQGNASLTVTFSWTGLEPQDEPITCVLDVGDGSTFYSIQDCANHTSKQHTYPYTSAFEAAGKYQATLSVVGSERTAATEVTVDWTFAASPSQGEAPLDVTFGWGGFDPAGGALSCTFDPGDGSAPQAIGDCLATTTATHRYTDSGTFVASLTVRGAAGEAVKTAEVTNRATATCIDPSKIAGWQGTVSFSYDGSGGRYSVHRAAEATILVDTVYATTDHTVAWTGTITGGQGSYHDTETTPEYTKAFVGTNLLTESELPPYLTPSVSFSISGYDGDCRFSIGFDPVTDLKEIYSGTYDLGPYHIAELSLSEPVTDTAALRGQTALPIFSATSDEGHLFLATGGQGGFGFDAELEQALGGPENMGKASVSWNLTPIAAGGKVQNSSLEPLAQDTRTALVSVTGGTAGPCPELDPQQGHDQDVSGIHSDCRGSTTSSWPPPSTPSNGVVARYEAQASDMEWVRQPDDPTTTLDFQTYYPIRATVEVSWYREEDGCAEEGTYVGTIDVSDGFGGLMRYYPAGREGIPPGAYTAYARATVWVPVVYSGVDGCTGPATTDVPVTFFTTSHATDLDASPYSLVQPGGVLSGSYANGFGDTSWNFVFPRLGDAP